MLVSDVFQFIPGYIKDNLGVIIQQNKFPRPFPASYEPETVTISPKISPYIFCKLCETGPALKNSLSQTVICTKLYDEFESITDATADDTRLIINRNISYFTAVLLQCKDPEQIKYLIEEKVSNPNMLVLCEYYMLQLKTTLDEIFYDQNLKERFLKDITEFYLEIIRVHFHFNDLKLKHPTYDLIPSYVPHTLKNRLLLISLLPRKMTVKQVINNLSPELNNCCGRFILTEDYTITPELFVELCKALPLKPLPPKIRINIVTAFEQFIWKGHLYTPPKLKARAVEYEGEQANLGVNFPDHVLIAQVLCYLQANWQQLWYLMNWPRSIEIVQRVHFLKTVENWTPDIPALIDFIAKP